MTTVIGVTDVTKRFGRTRALDGVTLRAGPGVTALLGPNGAGKTTLLRVLATALQPDSGEVRILGHDVSAGAGQLAVRRTLGYLPQDPGHYRTFTAYDFVDYFAILKEVAGSERRREVVRVLGAVGMTDHMHQRMGRLSGGMRRRVALAQALLGKPEVMILDEPTVGLDPGERLRFRDIVSTAALDGTVVLSTHLTDDVAALSSHVVVLHRGRVLFTGTPAALADHATGHVWLSPSRDPDAFLSWVTGDGVYRHIGTPPIGTSASAPTIEDGYLMLTERLQDRDPTMRPT